MIKCCNCGRGIMNEESTYGGIEYVQGEELDKNTVAFNQYPPGDVGLGYACSLVCFHEFVDKRDHA